MFVHEIGLLAYLQKLYLFEGEGGGVKLYKCVISINNNNNNNNNLYKLLN